MYGGPPGPLVWSRAAHAGLRPQRGHGGHEEGRVVRLLLAVEGVAGGVAGVLQRLHPRHTPAVGQQATCNQGGYLVTTILQILI